jgi:hypothetical protein
VFPHRDPLSHKGRYRELDNLDTFLLFKLLNMAEGRCNCGSIKVSISALPEQSAICYWYAHQDIVTLVRLTHYNSANCRRAGSSIGSIVYVFDKSEVKINDPEGSIKSYKDSDTKSGNSITRQFCATCGW